MYPFDYDDEFEFDDNGRRRGGGRDDDSPSYPGAPGRFPGGGPGFPGGMPGGFPGGFPGGIDQLRPPTSPPPSFIPQTFTVTQQQEFTRRGGVGGIRRCMFRFTFVWMRNGNSFWFFPMFVLGNSVIGFRWRGQRRGWVYDSINRNRILFFQCY